MADRVDGLHAVPPPKHSVRGDALVHGPHAPPGGAPPGAADRRPSPQGLRLAAAPGGRERAVSARAADAERPGPGRLRRVRRRAAATRLGRGHGDAASRARRRHLQRPPAKDGGKGDAGGQGGGGERKPNEVRLPGQHEPRDPDAPHLDHWLRRGHRGRTRGRSGGAGPAVCAAHREKREPVARDPRRGPQPLEARGGRDGSHNRARQPHRAGRGDRRSVCPAGPEFRNFPPYGHRRHSGVGSGRRGGGAHRAAQPHFQRHQVHQRGRRRGGASARHRRGGRAGGRGHRHRHAPRAGHGPVQGIPTGLRGTRPRI